MTTQQPDSNARLEVILETMAANIKQIGTDVQQLKEENAKQQIKLEEEVKRWDDRFFQFTKDNLQTSRTIILTAGAAIILAPLVQAVSPVIGELGNQLLRYWFKS